MLIRLQTQPEVVQVAVDVKGRAAGSVTLRSAAMPSAPSWTRHLSAEASAVAQHATAPGEASAAEPRTSAAAITTTPRLVPTAGVVAAVALAEQHTSPGGLSAANFLRPPVGPPATGGQEMVAAALHPPSALSPTELCCDTMRCNCQSLVAEPTGISGEWSEFSWR